MRFNLMTKAHDFADTKPHFYLIYKEQNNLSSPVPSKHPTSFTSFWVNEVNEVGFFCCLLLLRLFCFLVNEVKMRFSNQIVPLLP